MKRISQVTIGAVALLHVYIAWFEIFAWTDVGPDVFSTIPADVFADTVDIAANQGIYNLFLAAGLIWSLTIREEAWSFRVAMVFLGFVAIAGITAAVTLTVGNGLPQLVSSLIAVAATLLSRRAETSTAAAAG